MCLNNARSSFVDPIGEKLEKIPVKITYYSVTSNVISSINIQIKDNLGRLANFAGENQILFIHLKQV